jgi:hypothetical protein
MGAAKVNQQLPRVLLKSCASAAIVLSNIFQMENMPEGQLSYVCCASRSKRAPLESPDV